MKKKYDMKKICKLLDKIGVKYTIDKNVISIDPFYCDGAQDFWIKFYEDGSFQEFAVVPDEQPTELDDNWVMMHGAAVMKYNEAKDEWCCPRCGYWYENNGRFATRPSQWNCPQCRLPLNNPRHTVDIVTDNIYNNRR